MFEAFFKIYLLPRWLEFLQSRLHASSLLFCSVTVQIKLLLCNICFYGMHWMNKLQLCCMNHLQDIDAYSHALLCRLLLWFKVVLYHPGMFELYFCYYIDGVAVGNRLHHT